LRTYLVNLERRRDRLAAMQRQLDSLGIPFTHFPATDANKLEPACIKEAFPPGPLGQLSRGDIACTLSHVRLLDTFLRSKDEVAVVLEDDIVLSPDAARWICHDDWLPSDFSVIKLERFGPQNQKLVVGKGWSLGEGRELAPLLSKHGGSAAYIIARKAAERFLETASDRLSLPIDHLLFNPNNSNLALELRPLQFLPALGQQQEEVGGISEIRKWRKGEQPKGLSYLSREAVRAWYEVRRVPQQLASIVSGYGHLRQIEFR